MPASESAAPASGHVPPMGRLEGRSTIREAACDAQVSVALPVSELGVKVIVPGGVKFWDGAPKVQVGVSTALGGADFPTTLRTTLPLNPPGPVTVIRHEPDWPGAVIVMVELVHPGATLTADEPTVTVTAEDKALMA